MQLAAIRTRLLDAKSTLLNYMQSKMLSGEMHGVADAAMDIREIDAKLELLDELERQR